MENRDSLFYRTPFYMTYPMQNLYLTEMEYEKDMERMKALYPKEVSQLQQMVERRCDEMEYEGSRMYDENPDRYMLEEEVRRLYEQFLRENPQYGNMVPPPMPRPEEPMMPRPDGMRPPMPRPEEPMMPRPDGMRPSMPRPEEPMMPRPDGMRPPMPRPDDMREPMRLPEEDLSAQNQRYNENTWLRSLIGILFHDEIYRRRCRHRRCNRWW